MSYCPFMSFQKSNYEGIVYCLKDECKLADEEGDCLIKQALQCYVDKERARAATEEVFENMIRDIKKGGK